MTPEPQTSECIDDQMLLDFNTGRLADETLVQRVAEHLNRCDRCDSRLSSLPQDSIVALLRAPDPLESLRDSDELSLTYSIAPTQSLARGTSEFARARGVERKVDADDLPVRIDRYFVVCKLGSGGFAHVFLAKDPEQNRLVAIKTPRVDRLSTRQQRDSFLREARTVATLEHPHIVPMYDCRELADGRCIVVMRYIEGQTLRDAMKRKRFTATEIAELVARVADALQHAHAKEIWHRDVTPANILLDRQGQPHLADFGLAVHEQRQGVDIYDAAGTCHYMSPEQIEGRPKSLDGRTDIWSLGVVLYELLTRQRPFRGGSPDEINADIQERPHRPLLSVAPKIPAELARICERCLRKNAGERYARAADLAADLRAFLQRPQWRKAALVAGLAATVVLGTMAAALAFYHSSRTQPPNVATGLGTSSTAGGSGGIAPAGTWQPILAREAVEAAWLHRGANTYTSDRERERLVARHDTDRGFLSYGELESADFQVRFVMTIENWKGSGGFFWALHDDRTAFPERKHRCLVLVTRRVRSEPTQLELSLEAMEFIPSPFDNTKLICHHAHQFAWARIDLPAQPRLAFQLTMERGKLVEIRLNDRGVNLTWEGSNVAWSNVSPSNYGFMTFDGVVTVENATLNTEELAHGEEE